VSIHSPDAQVEGAGAERDVRNIAVCVWTTCPQSLHKCRGAGHLNCESWCPNQDGTSDWRILTTRPTTR